MRRTCEIPLEPQKPTRTRTPSSQAQCQRATKPPARFSSVLQRGAAALRRPATMRSSRCRVQPSRQFPADRRSSLLAFALNRLQHPPILIAEGSPLQQVRPISQRLAQLLLTPPTPNLLVIPIQKDIRRAQPAKLRRPRIVRIVQQSSRSMLRARDAFFDGLDLPISHAEAF